MSHHGTIAVPCREGSIGEGQATRVEHCKAVVAMAPCQQCILIGHIRADYKVLVSLVVVAWKLGDLTTACEIAKTEPREKKCSQEGTRGDEVKDLLARMQDPNEEPTYEEVLEAYTTSRCDDKSRHPDELWEEYIPECEGGEPVRWGFDPGMWMELKTENIE